MILQITDWDEHFENAASRKLKRLDWVAIPNKTDGEGYTALVDHPDAAAHLGAWYAIIEAASKQDPRGRLPSGIPQDIGGICRSLGRMSRLPAAVFAAVIPRLLEIGWLQEQVLLNQQNNTIIVAESPNVVAESPNVVAESPNVVADSGRLVAAHRRELQGTTGKGTTGKGIELQGQGTTATRAARASALDCWKSDAQFARFAADYLQTGKRLIDADFAAAYKVWCSLSIEQKLARVAALNRHAAAHRAAPEFVPTPRNFLNTEWERAPRPVLQQSAASKADAVKELALANLKRNGRLI